MARKHWMALAALGCALAQSAASAEGPAYSADGALLFPADYRDWTFLTSSFDLSYNKPIPGASWLGSLLDNVYVTPEAYRAFLKTGVWPDKTVFVKENREALSAGSIAKGGKFQGKLASVEFHVKDETRFAGKWAFFVSDGKSPGRLMPPGAACYSCHEQHGATDTTFVQFYPTLIEVAISKGVFDASK